MLLELNSEMFNAILYSVKNLISVYKMYVTLKFDDNGCCRIHSISDGNEEIVTDERYLVMPWEMVTRHRKNMTLAEAVGSIFGQIEFEAKESGRREREKERIKKKHKEYYESHMKKEMEILNKLVNWYKFKLNEIREATVDSRPRKLRKLYRHSEVNKDIGVMIDSVGIINLVNYPKFPPELELLEYQDNDKNYYI